MTAQELVTLIYTGAQLVAEMALAVFFSSAPCANIT